MRLSVAVAALIASSMAFATAQANPSGDSRIVGGTNGTITDHPWQVALLNPDAPSVFQAQFCGGTIAATRRIVTAAHCVVTSDQEGNLTTTPKAPASIVVMAGVDFLREDEPRSPNEQLLSVTAIRVHPSWNPQTNVGDLAILELGEPIALGTTARAIGLSAGAPAGSTVRISGWGNTRQDIAGDPSDDQGVFAKQLQQTDTQVVSDASCNAAYQQGGGTISGAVMLCAASPGKDTCQGDSGGPLVTGLGADPKLAGVVSFGIGCADSRFPGVYAEVVQGSTLASFITSNLPDAPKTSAPPTLTGSAAVGQVLTCTSPTWTGATSVTSQVRRSAASAGGAPEAATQPTAGQSVTYTVVAADQGRTLTCHSEASGEGGVASATSAPLTIPAPPRPRPRPRPRPSPRRPPAPRPRPCVRPRAPSPRAAVASAPSSS